MKLELDVDAMLIALVLRWLYCGDTQVLWCFAGYTVVTPRCFGAALAILWQRPSALVLRLLHSNAQSLHIRIQTPYKLQQLLYNRLVFPYKLYKLYDQEAKFAG